jgi:glycosyltransferase A (GT-A) superfamily protein (DUF2064 family)
MAKAPVAGRVKTRLCPPCTPEQAAALAAAALSDTLEAVARSGADRRILALDGQPGDWLPAGFEVVAQVDGPFDRRLDAAWAAADGPGVQLAMDTPQVTAGLLDRAMAALGDPRRCMLGLADDGGWWAIGLGRRVPGLFAGVPMSTATTGSAQARRCRALGLDLGYLPSLRDVDRIDDALAVAAAAPATRFAAAVRDLTALSG